MNYRMILSLLGDVLLVIGAFLLLPCIVAVIYGEPELWTLLATAAGSGLLGGLFILLRPKRRRELHARDGFVMVALSWILISMRPSPTMHSRKPRAALHVPFSSFHFHPALPLHITL